MIFGNPWAWLGLGALALPVLLHLLARSRAPVRRLPTLRFLSGPRPVAVARSRLTDIPLLVLRLAILAIAVAALARPIFLTAEREERWANLTARVVVVDTSRSAPATRDATRAIGVEALAGSSVGVLVETDLYEDLGSALEGAMGWLERHPGRREIVLLSDFRVGFRAGEGEGTGGVEVAGGNGGFGTINGFDPELLGVLPPEVGIELLRLPPVDSMDAMDSMDPVDSGRPGSRRITLLHDPADETSVSAMVQAVETVAGDGALDVDGELDIAIVLPGAEFPPASAPDAIGPLSGRVMSDLVLTLARDAVLNEAAAGADIADPTVGIAANEETNAWIPVIRNRRGEVVVLAGAVEGRVAGAGSNRLFLMSLAPAGSLAATTLLEAVGRLGGRDPPDPHADAGTDATHFFTDAELAALTRPAIASPARGVRGRGVRGHDAESAEGSEWGDARRDGLEATDTSDARWGWLLVLVLLIWEGRMRRRVDAEDD